MLESCMPNVDDLKIGLVIPCYNEEERLNVDSFAEGIEKNSNLTLLFVDDGSSDGTLDVIKKITANSPERVFSLHLKSNHGKGEAVRQGMLSFVTKGEHDIIGFWDADLAVSLDEFKNFITEFSNSEILSVIGSRVHLAGRKIGRVHTRHYLGRLFATLMSITFKMPIYDTQCGAKLFRAETIKAILDEPFSSRWIFDVELFIRISKLDFVKEFVWLYELPLKEWKDVGGTKRTLGAYGVAIRDYLKLIVKYL